MQCVPEYGEVWASVERGEKGRVIVVSWNVDNLQRGG